MNNIISIMGFYIDIIKILKLKIITEVSNY